LKGKTPGAHHLALDADDFGNVIAGERLDVSAVSHLRIGHDGCRIRIDEHDFVALLPQSLARLGAGVVKFAGLSDDDRAGTNDKNFVDISSLGHRFQSARKLTVCVRMSKHFT
jgi:hypothetical protein